MKHIVAVLLMIVVMTMVGNGVNTCDECTNGCAVKEYDGCNTCTYTATCKDGEWTRQRTGVCTAMDCPVKIANPYSRYGEVE